MTHKDELILIKITEYCDGIEETVGRCENQFEKFNSDRDYRQSVSFAILQIGELANSLSDDFKNETNGEMEWHQIRGMRNIIAHGYGEIRLEELWHTATDDIPILKKFCGKYLGND